MAEVLRLLWTRGIYTAEILRSEIDVGGHDLVLTLGAVTRHIQMKSSRIGGRTAKQSVNLRLLERPSGCFVWQVVGDDLRVGHYLFFGELPGRPMELPEGLPVTRHTKANSLGIKAAKPQHRDLPLRLFTRCETLDELLDALLGQEAWLPTATGKDADGPTAEITPPAFRPLHD